MSQQENRTYAFGPFVVQVSDRMLLREGKPVPLTPKAFDTLVILVEGSGLVIEKEELLSRIWPDTFVEEANLAVNILTLRKALGEMPEGGQYIQTVPRRGYCFVAAVTQVPNECARQAEAVKGEPISSPQAAGAEAVVDTESATGRDIRRPFAGHKLVAIAALAVAFIAIGGAVLLKNQRGERDAPQMRRLAVIPLNNQRPDEETDFLGFALADTIITKLSYASSLVVRPSSYVEKYSNQEIDPKKVAEELDVDTLLTGSYLKDGQDLRVTAQLIDVRSGQKLWGETIDVKWDNKLTLQDYVARQILKGLSLNLTPAEDQRLASGSPQDARAYEFYLRGLHLLSTNRHPDAIGMLEKSVETDPNYSLAWAYLGRAYSISALQYFSGRKDYLKAEAAYDQALALSPSEFEPRILIAILYTETNRAEEAATILRQVLEANPNHAGALWQLSYTYRYAGMLKESIEEGERARQLDTNLSSHQFNSYFYAGEYEKFINSLPTREDYYVIFYRGLGYYYQGDHERAATAFDRAYELNHLTVISQIGKAFRLAIAAQELEGIELLKAAESKTEKGGVADGEIIYKLAQAYAVLGEKAAALRMLRRSIEGGFFCYPYFASDPLLENIRGETLYPTIMDMARNRHEEFKRRFF